MKKAKKTPPAAKISALDSNQVSRILGYELSVIRGDLFKTVLISFVLIGVIIGLSFYLR